jgi:predicted O-methyltransferase YrrM
MTELPSTQYPSHWESLQRQATSIGFDMAAHAEVGALLRSLVGSKPGGHFLELGTGIGASLCWMAEGMDDQSQIISIDNDPQLCEIVSGYYQGNPQVLIECMDGAQWIDHYQGQSFDLIFADAWPGKYSHLQQTLDLLKIGGLYVIDDMNPQPNWPAGHEKKAEALLKELHERPELQVTYIDWSTGVVLAAKVNI